MLCWEGSQPPFIADASSAVLILEDPGPLAGTRYFLETQMNRRGLFARWRVGCSGAPSLARRWLGLQLFDACLFTILCFAGLLSALEKDGLLSILDEDVPTPLLIQDEKMYRRCRFPLQRHQMLGRSNGPALWGAS